ncbi:hypothetical protein GGS26DRAFT_590176 [Hypomontagnella submonticulosa]|nr:hypothetical protein GGS26DRAFT_590176 [Hypomontagnella submonticulosa]
MARERKKVPAPVRGVRALTRRAKLDKAQQKHADDTWRNLNPLKVPPRMKHKTTFELVQNTDKKKKLEFKITTDSHPPPGFEFVPVGNPNLSQLCKDLSREKDAMIFIVSDAKNPDNLEHHMNRVGYHFRQMIADQARAMLQRDGQFVHATRMHRPGKPEPIPKSQAEIDAQADAVLRDLFPRIPNTDRQEIIQHAFRKDATFHGDPVVGMAKGLTLARRVQLAAIAHIRHTHTRYDELLRETHYLNARKAVEKPCLDIIVKWRGDEETGRDQLDEILREVIEISDTEEDSEEENSSTESVPAQPVNTVLTATFTQNTADPQRIRPADRQLPAQVQRRDPSVPSTLTSSRQKAIAKAEKKNARKTRRFRRYAAAAEAIAGSSDQRGHANDSSVAPSGTAAMDFARSPGAIYTIDSSREPTVAARGTPTIEQMPRHSEMRAHPQRFIAESRRERMSAVPHSIPEAHRYASPQPMRELEGYRPKVGHAPASYGHPQAPLSPVRHGLQDMLLQSIEPASPGAPRESQEAPRPVFHEPQRFPEAPRAIPRTLYEPAGSISHPLSPRIMNNGNELVTIRRHDANYPAANPEGFPSFVQIHRQDRGEGLRRAEAEYHTDRPVPSVRTTGQDSFQDQHRPVMNDGLPPYNGDVPGRIRANPIIVDDDPYRPRQVVEVHHPDGDYEAPFLRRGDLVRDIPLRAHPRPRIQDDARVVLLDSPPTRPRSAFDYRGPVNHARHRAAPYQVPGMHGMSSARFYRHVVGAPSDPEFGHHREPLRGEHLVPGPIEWQGNAPREVRAVPVRSARPEVRYGGAENHFEERPGFTSLPGLHQAPSETRYYGLDEPSYNRYDHQPFVAPATRSHYIESREHPLQHHVPERRIVHVDR